MYINPFFFFFLQNKISLYPEPVFPPDKLANVKEFWGKKEKATDRTSLIKYSNASANNIHVNWQIEVLLF